MSIVLSAADLRYVVDGRTILEGVTVQACSGQVLAVRGPSGSGKTSLLSMLGGLVAPSAGTVTLDGAQVTPSSDVALRRRFGLVLQGNGLVAALTARENVAVVLQAARVPRGEVRSRVQAVLDRVGLAPVADHLVEDLSGGQQQRVAVARALVTDTPIMMADEPTGNLDSQVTVEIMNLLQRLNRERGLTLILVTHEEDVAAYAGRIVRMRDGQVRGDTRQAPRRGDAARQGAERGIEA